MRKSKTINFRGQNVQVWELTVPEVHAFMHKMRAKGEEMKAFLRERKANPDAVEPEVEPPHVLDALMDSPVPFELVARCVPSLTEADLCCGEVSASDLEPLYAAVEAVNPFFMRLAGKVLGTEKPAPART